MRMPRDCSGEDLVRSLKTFGYSTTRQSGSHIRLTTTLNGEHHITVPAHDPLKVGTLSGIIGDIAEHAGLTRDEVTTRLFGS